MFQIAGSSFAEGFSERRQIAESSSHGSLRAENEDVHDRPGRRRHHPRRLSRTFVGL